MMGTWIVLGVLVIGVVMALLTVRKNVKGGGCPAQASGQAKDGSGANRTG